MQQKSPEAILKKYSFIIMSLQSSFQGHKESHYNVKPQRHEPNTTLTHTEMQRQTLLPYCFFELIYGYFGRSYYTTVVLLSIIKFKGK